MRQAVILVGGLGSRLGAATVSTPKPVLPCGDRPFLAWLLRELVRFGVEDVVLLAGHLAPALKAALPRVVATLPRPVSIRVLVEPLRAGTGGALFHARHVLDAQFLLLNGDSILDFNLARLIGGAPPDENRIVLRPVAHTGRFGVVELGEDDRVAAFHPRAERDGPGLVNAGVYLFGREMLELLSGACSLEADILPALAAAGRLRATVADGFFIDIGVPDDLARAQTALPRALHRPALFLDRDGTINHDHGWVGTRERWQWVDGAIEAMALATDLGWHVFVVTNQSGIARGLYDEAALARLHGWMTAEIRQGGGTVDDLRHCPFHEDAVLASYRRASPMRKPAPGMILDLLERWEVDPAHSILVGDQPSDMQAAVAACIEGVPFRGGNLHDLVAPLLHRASAAPVDPVSR